MADKPTYEELEQKVLELERTNLEKLESEKKYRGLMDDSPDPFVLFDSKLNYVDINKSAMKYVPSGTKKEDIIGKNLADILPSSKKSGRYDKYLNVMQTGEPYISEDLIPDPIFGKTHFVFKCFKLGQGLGHIATDITDRKKAEKELNKRMHQMETFNRISVDRELKMVELKKEINTLLEKAGEKKKYPTSG